MRSPVYVKQAAIGKSALIALAYNQPTFNVGVGVLLSSDAAALTYSVQFTADDFGPDAFSLVTLSQTTTVITVTDPSLPLRGGVAVGDIVQLRNTGFANIDGVYTVTTAPSPTTYTVTSGTSQSAVAGFPSQHAYWRLFPAATALTAATTRQFGSLVASGATGPCTGVLLNVTALGAGSATLVVVQGTGS